MPPRTTTRSPASPRTCGRPEPRTCRTTKTRKSFVPSHKSYERAMLDSGPQVPITQVYSAAHSARQERHSDPLIALDVPDPSDDARIEIPCLAKFPLLGFGFDLKAVYHRVTRGPDYRNPLIGSLRHRWKCPSLDRNGVARGDRIDLSFEGVGSANCILVQLGVTIDVR